VLFITAKFAGYMVQHTINDYLIDNNGSHELYYDIQKHIYRWNRYEPFIWAGGLFIQSCGKDYNKSMITLRTVSYNLVLEALRDTIREST